MAALRQGEWTTYKDLKDAYFHLPITKRSRKYLRFMIGDKVYQCRALPFRLSTTPLVFTRVINVISAYAHIQGIRVHMHMGDWLFRALIKLELLHHTQ